MTRVGIATGYDGVVEPLAKPPKAVTVEVMNPESMFSIRDEAIKEAARCIDKHSSDVNLKFSITFGHNTSKKYVVLSTGLLWMQPVILAGHSKERRGEATPIRTSIANMIDIKVKNPGSSPYSGEPAKL